ncbi:hypothetical protein [Hydrogenimonas thermophila]|nr:hypothetical protein [Hydrogenimonas thermophila]WOE69235.1 hypothetical protein RZR91_08960 [Hydrogenimonas thermophila]WOE71745.1 hypothetical protein RZR97_08935 [Hydrogenimonas thermophila]
MIRNISILAFFVLIILAGSAWFTGGQIALINATAGYISAMLVVAASAFGYYRLVDGADEVTTNHNLPDITEQIDDKYGLWDEENEVPDDPKELLKEEKLRLKRSKRGLKAIIKTSKPAISIYRLIAYVILIVTVYKLISADIFDAVVFLLGSTVAPLLVAGYLYFRR